jgi:hypothetical protein
LILFKIISLVVCNSTQEIGVFLGSSQQHPKKLHNFLLAKWNRQECKLSWRFTTTPKEMVNSLAVGFCQSTNSKTPTNFHFGVMLNNYPGK